MTRNVWVKLGKFSRRIGGKGSGLLRSLFPGLESGWVTASRDQRGLVNQPDGKAARRFLWRIKGTLLANVSTQPGSVEGFAGLQGRGSCMPTSGFDDSFVDDDENSVDTDSNAASMGQATHIHTLTPTLSLSTHDFLFAAVQQSVYRVLGPLNLGSSQSPRKLMLKDSGDVSLGRRPHGPSSAKNAGGGAERADDAS